MATISTLVQYLADIDFPANRQHLIHHARLQRAPEEIIESLKQLPDKKYHSVSDLWNTVSSFPEKHFVQNDESRFVKYLTPGDIINKLDELNLLDVRTRPRFNQGHLKGACWIGPDNPLEVVGKNFKKTDTLVFYDNSDCDNTAKPIATQIQHEGFTESYVLKGGYNGWIETQFENHPELLKSDRDEILASAEEDLPHWRPPL